MARFLFFGSPQPTLENLLVEHLSVLRARGYSPHTVRNRLVHIRLFLRWCAQHNIHSVPDIKLPVLEQYQRDLSVYRKQNGLPLELVSQHARLVPLRVWFRWMQLAGHIRQNPAERLQLPRLGRHLPRNVLSTTEVSRVMRQPDVKQMIGLPAAVSAEFST